MLHLQDRPISAEPETDLIFLLDRTATGDRDAFAEVYARTAPQLYGIVLRICRHEAAAADAMQDTYIKIWTSSGAFDAGAMTPLAWMSSLARNAAIDCRRRDRARPASPPADDSLLDGVVDDDDDAWPVRGRLADIRSCLALMPDDARRMVLAAFYNGASLAELEHLFARPAAVIKPLMRRTLLAVKRCLDA